MHINLLKEMELEEKRRELDQGKLITPEKTNNKRSALYHSARTTAVKKSRFALPPPLNGSIYSLREAMQLFRKTDMSRRVFYDMANSEARWKILCSLATFDRSCKNMHEGILSPTLEHGIDRG